MFLLGDPRTWGSTAAVLTQYRSSSILYMLLLLLIIIVTTTDEQGFSPVGLPVWTAVDFSRKGNGLVHIY